MKFLLLLALWTSGKIVGVRGSVPCFVTLARLLNLSVPGLLICQVDIKVFSLFPWEYERGVRKGEAWCPTHRRCPVNQDGFQFSSPVLTTESLIRNVCQKPPLVSLYRYFLLVNYTSVDFFFISVRSISVWRVLALTP